VSERLVRLEQAVEVALTAGVGVSALLLVAGLLLGASGALRWGILLLMLTPVARVVVVTVGLVLARDWLFAAVSLFVLGILAYGVWVALGVSRAA
jgi:uncharacterized membrane protein